MITFEQAQEIRAMRSELDENYRELAARFGASTATIWKICRRPPHRMSPETDGPSYHNSLLSLFQQITAEDTDAMSSQLINILGYDSYGF